MAAHNLNAMGEQEEKETPQSESTPAQQEVAEEPKETDKMLEKKDDKPETDKDKVKGSSKPSSKPSTPTADAKEAKDEKKEEIIDIPDSESKPNGADCDERKLSTEDREVKPKKIPIGGLKLPGFFTNTKPKADGDGADGELLEKEQKEETAVEEKPVKKEEKPAKNFGERLRSFFVRRPAEKQAKQQAANNGGDADNKSGKL